jgi:hypothetical protein
MRATARPLGAAGGPGPGRAYRGQVRGGTARNAPGETLQRGGRGNHAEYRQGNPPPGGWQIKRGFYREVVTLGDRPEGTQGAGAGTEDRSA